jgi:N-acetylglucosamine malate deacetylase 1
MESANKYEVDVLAIGAHPDDIELACGGTVAKITSEGLSVAIVDFTNGELGSRGTPEIRAEEAKRGAEIMGVRFRENLGFPDGKLRVTDEAVDKMIVMLRKYRPKAVLVNPPHERHPDHEGSHNILRTAMFKSGLIKVETEYEAIPQKTHRIRKMYCYMQSYEFTRKPDFYVDITSSFETKMNAIKAFTSQVWVPGVSDPDGPVTRLSRPEFLEELEARAVYFGTQIGVRYAEAFYSVEPIGIKNFGSLLL